MPHQEIEITIAPDGRVEYTIRGVKGSACTSISELLEQLGEVEYEEKTGEYDAEPDNVSVNIDLA